MEDLIEKNIQKEGYRLHLTVDPFNKRVRVEDYLGHFESCMREALSAAKEISAEKLIFKARKEDSAALLEHGFVFEALIRRFYLGSDCFFWAKYFRDERRASSRWVKEDDLLVSVKKVQVGMIKEKVPSSYILRKVEKGDAEKLAQLYKKVFQVYPTPMNQPDYIRKCMEKGTVFFVYMHKGEIVSAASAEIDSFYRNAEITDCATLPEHRQFGLMKHVITELEQYLTSHGIFCLYSIARALSFGMNAALHQLGFQYAGRLANNCNIFDKLEDMNMWVKNGS